MATIKGTNSGQTSTGTTAADLIYGYGGNDSLYGRAGNDTIWGGLGDDKLWGEAGNDILRGEDGADFIYSGDGNDTVYGGSGNDTLYGDGGTDTIYGDAGNDVLKGGTGISKLYGGDGIDTAHYDPSASDIDDIGNYLSGSYIEAETVYIYNKTTDNGKPTKTLIGNTDVNHEGHDQSVWFGGGGKAINVAYTEGNPDLVVVGAGGLSYHGPDHGGLSRVTGTAVNDEFYGGCGNDILKGGAGNDDFHIRGGEDLMISETNDADRFYFEPDVYGTSATVSGFNGAGASGGDTIHIWSGQKDALKISTAGGKTTLDVFDEYTTNTITVDAIGLKEGIDYFFV
jgi:Ca2+-binding RTX toxin-like protein